MSFLKKLFGFGNEEDKEDSGDNHRELDSDNSPLGGESPHDSNDEENIEVIINEQVIDEVVELVEEVEADDTKDRCIKSIEEICHDIAEIVEQEDEFHHEDYDFEVIETVAEQKNGIKNDITLNYENDVKRDNDSIVNSKDNTNKDDLEGTVEEIEIEKAYGEDSKENNKENSSSEIVEADEKIVFDTEKDEICSIEEDFGDNSVIEIEIETEVVEEVVEKKSFFAKLKAGVQKTRNSIFDNINTVFNMFTEIDEDLFEELEEALILADMGVDTSLYIINELRKNVKKKGITDVHDVKDVLVEIISEILTKDDTDLVIEPNTVILVIGVNGAGKTTTIGKLSHNFIQKGHSVTVAAADTFRAAAIDQLQVWADRTGANLIRRDEGSDPASVVFDACKSAKAKGTDILIVDTAGRLQNKKNLMEELKKINRIIEREYGEAKKEVFLVLDSTTGQNAMQQAKLFNESAEITGLILTKLDGTAKGGVIVSIKNELKVPVRYVGLGEKIDDLDEFDGKEFANAIFK